MTDLAGGETCHALTLATRLKRSGKPGFGGLTNCRPNVHQREGAGAEEFAPADLQAMNVGDVEDLERFGSP